MYRKKMTKAKGDFSWQSLSAEVQLSNDQQVNNKHRSVN